MSDIKRQAYNALMLELYKENQNFLNKAIFGISTLAIPFLLNSVDKNHHSLIVSILFGASLLGFLGVIIFQILSLKAARDGCDKSMENIVSSIDDGEVLFNKARFLDICREWLFIAAFIMLTLALFTGIIEKEIKMTKNNNGKEMQNSYTPPKAAISEQRSYVPPKAVVTENKPVSGAGGSTSNTEQGQTSSNNETGNK